MEDSVDLSRQRLVLLEERGRTLTEIERLKSSVAFSIEVVAEEGDPELWEREKTLALIRGLEAKVAEIDRAVRKLDQGRYGVCERCDHAISPARLEAVPTAMFCVKCKQEMERASRLQVQREV